MSIGEELLARELPALDASQEQREEKLALLRREFLGCWPDKVRASFQLISADEEACGGKGISCFSVQRWRRMACRRIFRSA